MAIALRCPGCGKAYQIREELAGKVAQCRCGQKLTIPAAPVRPAEPALATLLEEEIAAPPASPLAPLPQRGGPWRPRPSPAFGAALGKKKGRGVSPTAVIVILGGAAALAALGLGIYLLAGPDATSSSIVAQPSSAAQSSDAAEPAADAAEPSAGVTTRSTPPAIRWATPEAAFEAYFKALREQDWRTIYEVVSPENQHNLAYETTLKALDLAVTTGDSDFDAVCRKNGIDMAEFQGASFRSPPTPEARSQLIAKVKRTAEQLADKPGFVADALAAMVQKDPDARAGMSSLSGDFEFRLSNVVITGERASGSMTMTTHGATLMAPIAFCSVEGEWRIHDPNLFKGVFSPR